MGFPRILSKNNKIYTKLGEFCLSGDGNQFFIICYTCQAAIQTQDHFWKHIQDEHNFLHALKQDQSRGGGYMDADAELMPIPLYRKAHEDDQHGPIDAHEEDSQPDQQEPKDYTEMRCIEPNEVEIDIKVEPPSVATSHSLPPPPTTTQLKGAGVVVTQALASPLHYQLPHAVSPANPYATIVPAPSVVSTISTSGGGHPSLLPAHELPKETNSTTASASSAVSSDDGERWYICDFESCGLKFKYQSRLELHRSVHSKERRFACEICNASFKQSCNLSTHRKKKHALKGSRIIMQRF